MLLKEKLKNYHIILASQSPRRQELLKGLDIPFAVKTIDCEEIYPNSLPQDEIPVFLAELKAGAFLKEELKDNSLIITADTIVLLNNEVLGKPKNREEAIEMLQKLSGNKHTVVSGVCITTKEKKKSFSVKTLVQFKTLSLEEINYFIDNYPPMDKAGAYAIQEWIGYIGITNVEGSYYNIMGLPVQRLYEELQNF